MSSSKLGLGTGNDRFKRQILKVMKSKSFLGKRDAYRKKLNEKAFRVLFQPSALVQRTEEQLAVVLEWMKRFSYYKKLSGEDRLIFAKHMEYEEYDNGDIILEHGDRVRFFHICLGSLIMVAFTRKGAEQPRNKLWMGEIYGHQAPFTTSYDVCPWRLRAGEKTAVLTMPRRTYLGALHRLKSMTIWQKSLLFHGVVDSIDNSNNPESDIDVGDEEVEYKDDNPKQTTVCLANKELEILADFSKFRLLRPNETIYKKGNILQNIYIVGSGEISLIGEPYSDEHGMKTSLLKRKSGELFGSVQKALFQSQAGSKSSSIIELPYKSISKLPERIQTLIWKMLIISDSIQNNVVKNQLKMEHGLKWEMSEIIFFLKYFSKIHGYISDFCQCNF